MSRFALIMLMNILLSCQQVNKGKDSALTNVEKLEKERGVIEKDPTALSQDPSQIPVPLKIELSPKELTLTHGSSATFTALGHYPYSVRDLTAVVEWKSETPDLLVFDVPSAANLATSLGTGTATVSASFKGVSASVELTIVDAEVKALTVDAAPDVVELDPDDRGGVLPRTLPMKALGVLTNQSLQNLTDKASWVSSDEAVASFDKKAPGMLQCKRAGEVTVTATWEKFSATFSVRISVKPVTLVNLSASPDPVVLPLGTSATITVTGHYSNGTSREVTAEVAFASADDKVGLFADPAAKNKVTAVGPGQTVLTATLAKVKVDIPFVVTAAVMTGIEIEPKDVTQPLGVPLKFSAKALFSDGTELDYTSTVVWSSSDTSVSGVSNTSGEQGTINSVSKGPATIRADFGDFSAETVLTITDAKLSVITISPNSVTLAKGTAAVVTATGTYTDGNIIDLTETVRWISGNGAVLAVSDTAGNKGVISGLGVGMTTIRATYDGIVATIPGTVTSAQVVLLQTSATNPTVPLGRTKQFQAIATYTDGAVVDVTEQASWSFDILSTGYNYAGYVSNDVGTKGLATSIAVGKVGIIASFDGFVSSAELTVTEAAIVYVDVTSPQVLFTLGENGQMTATAFYTDSTTRDVTNPTGDPDLSMTWGAIDSVAAGTVVTIDPATGALTSGFEGGASVSATLVSAKFGTFTDTLGVSVQSVCVNGTRYSYFCFYLGAYGQSCDAVCAGGGGAYHPATNYAIGAGGTTAECTDTIEAISSFGAVDAVGSQPDDYGLGCGVLDFIGEEIVARYDAPVTTSLDSSPTFRRVCACTQ